MSFVRYQSPDEPAFTVFERSRFRVDHAIFLLPIAPLRKLLREKLQEQIEWNLQAMKLVEENRRLASCLEWLETIPDDPEKVIIADLKDQPAIDLVADHLIGMGGFERAFCPSCKVDYPADQVDREPWEFEEDGVTIRGCRSTCSQGHTIHVLIEEIDALDLESPD